MRGHTGEGVSHLGGGRLQGSFVCKNFARLIQDVRPGIWMSKVKHAVEGAGDRVERTPTHTLSVEKGVFNEAQDRSLIGQAVVDVVAPCVWRADQQRQARPVYASSLCMVGGRPGKGRRPVSALVGRG